MEKNTETLFCMLCDVNAGKTNVPLSTRFEFVIGSLTNLPPDQTTSWRTMPFHFCCIPEQNSAESCKCLEIEGKDPIYIRRGEHVFVPAGTRHRVSEIGTVPVRSCLWMHFRCTAFEDMDILQDYRVPFVIPADQTALLNTLMRELIHQPSTLDLNSSICQQLLGNAFVLELIRHSRKIVRKPDRTAGTLQIRRVLAVIDQSPVSIPNEKLAQYASLSLSRFLNVFHEVTGTSPGHYQERKRFRKACSLLLFSECQMKEIAEKLGYYDAYHFSRCFKMESGLSPSAFRAKWCGYKA